MKEEIIFSGFGGQGLMFLGKLVALTAIRQGLYATFIPSYGAEMRGGSAHCKVCISSEEIANPFIEHPSICLAMSQLAFDRFGTKVKQGGILVVNTSLVFRRNKNIKAKVFAENLNTKATELGSMKVANVLGLAIILKENEFVKKNMVAEVLKEQIKDEKILALNLEALNYF